MIVGGQTEARAQLSSTIIDYHVPFDQGYTREFFLQFGTQRLLRCKLQEKLPPVTWP